VCAANAVRSASLLAPDFLAVGGVDLLGLVAQDRDLFSREAARQEQIALFSELPELLRSELHRVLLLKSVGTGSPW
jgi:hypothetical protein